MEKKEKTIYEKLLAVQNELKAPKGQFKTEHDLIEYIKKYFKYNEDGTLSRFDRKNSNGTYDKDGYLILKIKGKQYKAHRIVYALFNSHFPKGEIDHVNRIRDDNRIENLRPVNRIENMKSAPKRRETDNISEKSINSGMNLFPS